MLWVLLACILCTLLVPPLVAMVEGVLMREGPREVGFWAFARSVGGTCHVRWGRRRSPVVRFVLPDAEGRARAVHSPGRRGWWIEARAYMRQPFGFAARICSPSAPPARWRAPGLEPLELYPEETEHLLDASLETTDERLLRWVLRHAQTRGVLDGLLVQTGAEAIEVLVAGSVVVLRGQAPRGVAAGNAAEMLGPSLVEGLRRLSSDLHDLAVALRETDDPAVEGGSCPGCGAPIDDDPWRCGRCETDHHRGCREMLGGCSTLGCAQSADAIHAGQATPLDDDHPEAPLLAH